MAPAFPHSPSHSRCLSNEQTQPQQHHSSVQPHCRPSPRCVVALRRSSLSLSLVVVVVAPGDRPLRWFCVPTTRRTPCVKCEDV